MVYLPIECFPTFGASRNDEIFAGLVNDKQHVRVIQTCQIPEITILAIRERRVTRSLRKTVRAQDDRLASFDRLAQSCTIALEEFGWEMYCIH